MIDEVRFLPASSFALDTLADIFTRSFENYFYPGVTTVEVLARRARIESLDLQHSLVMLAGEETAGQAMIGLRGDRAWCGGFGVLLRFRGLGLGRPLAAAMLDQARQAGARTFSLEVLTRNERAIRAYIGAGLRTRRDLLILEWRNPEEPRTENGHPQGQPRTEQRPASSDERSAIDESTLVGEVAEPARLLDRFAPLHLAPAAWQRDLPALLVQGGLRGLATPAGETAAAYLLYQAGADGSARIADLGATQVAQAGALLAALQAHFVRLITVNEPADSPLIAAFESAGFVETDRQHEMWIEL
ncbi:MAG: GNAT family N-acetyltransferase [Roseiflexaceae bacterium]